MTKKQAKKKAIGFDDLNDKLDRVIDTMATKEDIADIRAEMATKDDIADIRSEMTTKTDIKDMATKTDLDKKFKETFIMIDGLMKPLSELKMEYTGMMMQLSRHEAWIKLLAEKQGVTLPIQ